VTDEGCLSSFKDFKCGLVVPVSAHLSCFVLLDATNNGFFCSTWIVEVDSGESRFLFCFSNREIIILNRQLNKITYFTRGFDK